MQTKRIQYVLVLLLVLMVLLSAGCSSTESTTASGLPATATLVGQGKNFIYTTPADGRMYRVREGKVDGFRLVRKGEIYKAIGPVEGDDPTKDFDDYEYYFEPAAMTNKPPPTYR